MSSDALINCAFRTDPAVLANVGILQNELIAANDAGNAVVDNCV